MTGRCGWWCPPTTRRPGSAATLRRARRADRPRLHAAGGGQRLDRRHRRRGRAGSPPGARARSLVEEPEKGVGCAVDTGFRYAIAHGATLLARTDADCLPRPGWVAAARAALAGGRGPGLRADRRPARRARAARAGPCSARWSRVAARVRPAAPGAPRRHGYLAPYRMHAGNNMAITAALYLAVRRHAAAPLADRPASSSTGYAAHTAAIVAQPGDGGGELDPPAAGVRRASAPPRWYLDRGSGTLTADPR